MRHRSYSQPRRSRARHTATMRHHSVTKVLAVMLATVMGFGVVYVQTTFTHIENAFNVRDIDDLLGDWEDPYADPEDPQYGQDINILLLGSDVRDAVNQELGGGADVTGMRADATVLVHISADRTRIDAMSIPRDLRVRISDCVLPDGTPVRGWTAKFNVAFANGGKQFGDDRQVDVSSAAACAVNTVQDITNIRIDHYAVLDFAGFRDMVEAIDGVPMCIPNRMYAPKANLDVQAGPQVLDGVEALAFARARTGIGVGDGSDPTRIGRQQDLMENMFKKILTMNMLTDAGQLTQFARATASSIYLDSRLGDLNYLIGIGLSLSNMNMDNLTFITVPWMSPGDGSGDIIMAPGAEDVFRRIATDQPLSTPEPEPEPTSPADPGTSDPGTSDPGTSPTPSPGLSPTPTLEPEEPELTPLPKRWLRDQDDDAPPPPTLLETASTADLEILGECVY